MKRFITGLTLGLFLAAGAFAGGKKQAASSPDGKAVVNFYAATDHDSFLKRMVAEFNTAHPDIRVIYNSIPNDDYDDKIKVLAAGSSDMDAFWIRTPAQTQQYITNNALLDLGPFIQSSGLDLAPIRTTSLPGATRDGKIYGLPTTGSCWMLFYNKDLFDAKGLPYPENITWDQYLDLAKSLTYTENGKKYWGGVCPPWTMNLGASSAGEYLTAPEPLPYTRRYAQALHRMYVDDKSHPGIEEMSVGTFDINPFFEAGNVYMMIQGDWEFFLLKPAFTYAAAPMPVFEGVAPGSTVGQSSYYVVSPNSRHPKEAYRFIEWCTTSPQGTAIYAETGSVPSYSTPEALAAFRKSVNVPGVEYRFSAKVGGEQGTEPYYGEVNDAFIQEMQLYLIGEQSLDAMFNNFFKLRREIISNN
ncbi:MAG: sugar ABC transporter substrate-binding protein [Treponema sp.]|jgi:ABC-type glycerol-3-phosphate transport system substrate-binding protein|nr:sugar ABC transporter substrate-binding protein [Treponema sp.]